MTSEIEHILRYQVRLVVHCTTVANDKTQDQAYPALIMEMTVTGDEKRVESVGDDERNWIDDAR